MADAWGRIEQWLKTHAPAILADMRPGASPAEIRAAKEQLGCPFPEPVREWFATHDGATSCALLEYWELYLLVGGVTAWKTMKALYDNGTFA